ncbi:hypothetical protein ACFVFI_09180 [Streptomyces sp. NPDC057705]|uniref:hypothetical protein n=1 Tax=Streptomyces sp. NPDC057705 TaxID=3346222 RepID=UPI003697988B
MASGECLTVHFKSLLPLDANITTFIDTQFHDMSVLFAESSIRVNRGSTEDLSGYAWRLLDVNPDNQTIVADESALYVLRSNGEVWMYQDSFFGGSWLPLGPSSSTVEITAGGGRLFSRRGDGSIFLYSGTPMFWLHVDENPANAEMTAGDDALYVRRSNGVVRAFPHGAPILPGSWQLLDNNPATTRITATKGDLYQLHNTGSIWQYGGIPTVWSKIADNSPTVDITAADGHVYQRLNNGRLSRFPMLLGWLQVDDNPDTVQIAATGGEVYQRRGDRTIWRYTGTPDVWEELDSDLDLRSIAAGGGGLYKLRDDGSVFKAGSLAHLLAFDAGKCGTGNGTADQDELYDYRAGAGPDDVVVYIVRTIMSDSGPLDGCAQQLPFHQPGLVVESDVQNWVVAHEMGHVLGLDDIKGDTDALMFDGSAPYTNPPPNVARSESVTMISNQLTRPCGDWMLLDWNGSTSNITASTTELYQLHANGSVWRYTGKPITGWKQLNTGSVGAQQLAADAGRLFLLGSDGNVYETFDLGFSSYSNALDSAARTLQIAASGSRLYQRWNDGSVLRYSGTPLTWQPLDVNPSAGGLSQNAEIVADGTLLYKRDTLGRIYQYEGTPASGWLMLADKDTTAIAAGGGNLYQLRGVAGIWQYTGTPLTGWKQLDNDPTTRDIVADGADLYQRHANGNLFRHTGGTSWAPLDDSPATVHLVAAGGRLYQRHIAGFVWKKL